MPPQVPGSPLGASSGPAATEIDPPLSTPSPIQEAGVAAAATPPPASGSAPGASSGPVAPAVDPAIAAWWAAQHAAADIATPAEFDVTVAPPSSVQEAVDRCREGGSVLLLPGAHEGGVVLSKEVHLYGRGEATLRLAPGTGPVLTCTAEVATVDGLVVRFDSEHDDGQGDVFPVICVEGGGLLLRHCDVSGRLDGECMTGVQVEGRASHPSILGCRVHDCSNGVSFSRASDGVVEGCDVLSCSEGSIYILNASPVILANNIRGGDNEGVTISGVSAKPSVEGNTICEMKGQGVYVWGGADPSLVGNVILNNMDSGVFINDAKGVLKGNTICGNGEGGVWVSGKSGDPTLIGNTIRDHAGTYGFGVVIEASARGNVAWGEGNVFSGNKVAALGSFGKDPPEGPPQAAATAATAAALAATPADALLLRELECIVCKDIMLRPYMICHEGHASACLPCYGKLGACPVCRQRLLSPPARNLPLENATRSLFVPCPHVADGCPLDALRYADAGAHAGVCAWRKVRWSRNDESYV